tara:strand:+ start:684 stop:1271 length:588 start_codon:yes stop_codon:yes gene_type:complete
MNESKRKKTDPISNTENINEDIKVNSEPSTQELEASTTEIDLLKDSLKRSQADLINYRKRTDEERQTLIKYGNERLLVKILPILDEFNMALNHTQSDETQSAWSDGIRLIHRKLQSIIESEGVTPIDAKEKSFDPLEHEAIAQQESNVHEENQVINIIREGYKLHGRVLRPTQVVVSKKPNPAEESATQTEDKEN